MKTAVITYFLVLLAIMLSIIWFADFSKLQLSIAFIIFGILLALPSIRFKKKDKNEPSKD
jgi:positive regulator of sigma E activity